MSSDGALDLIEFGRLRKREKSPVRSSDILKIVAVAVQTMRYGLSTEEADGAKRCLTALAERAKWHDTYTLLRWLPGARAYDFEQCVEGATAAFVTALLATATRYRQSLQEWDTGLASIQLNFFTHGACWACAEWRYRRFDAEPGAPILSR